MQQSKSKIFFAIDKYLWALKLLPVHMYNLNVQLIVAIWKLDSLWSRETKDVEQCWKGFPPLILCAKLCCLFIHHSLEVTSYILMMRMGRVILEWVRARHPSVQKQLLSLSRAAQNIYIQSGRSHSRVSGIVYTLPGWWRWIVMFQINFHEYSLLITLKTV